MIVMFGSVGSTARVLGNESKTTLAHHGGAIVCFVKPHASARGIKQLKDQRTGKRIEVARTAVYGIKP